MTLPLFRPAPQAHELAALVQLRVLATLDELRAAIDSEIDPCVLVQIENAVDDALWDVTHARRGPQPKAPRDSGIVSVALAEQLASGAWRDQP